MTRMWKGNRGFTLLEILVVLAVLGVLAAVVVPNLSGFLSQGKSRAWEADRRLMEAAMNAWRTDIAQRAGNPWPTTSGQTVPEGQTWKGYMDLDALADGEFIKGCDSVKSADNTKNNCTKTVSGSYKWFISATGTVDAWYDSDSDAAVDSGETGFQSGIYP